MSSFDTDGSIDVRVRLKEQRQFKRDASDVAESVEKIGAAGDKASRGIDRTSRSARSGRPSLGKLAATAVVLGAGLLSIGQAKTAIDTTIGLAKAQSALHRNLGFSVRGAGEWAAAVKARGVDTSTLNLSFTNLAKNVVAAAGGSREHRRDLLREIRALDDRNSAIQATIAGYRSRQVLELAHVRGNRQATASLRARGIVEIAALRRENALNRARRTAAKQQLAALQGNKQAIAAFRSLGITQGQLRAGARAGGFPAFLDRIADGLARVKGGAPRTALAQKLLGRSMQSTLPIFTKGSRAMHEQLNLADKYGAVLRGKPIRSMKALMRAQREMEFAQIGWQVTFATTIAPALTKLILLGTSASQWIAKHSTLMKILIPVVIALAAAIWAVNIALAVIALGAGGAIAIGVIAGIAAIAVGLVFLYKRFATFRSVVDAVFGFVKKHWPLVVGIFTGGIGLVVAYIIKHWNGIIDFFSKLPGRVKRATVGLWDGIKDSFRNAINWIITKWNNLHFAMSAKKVHGHTVIPGFDLKTPNIPLLARGGTISPGGMAIVGDEGPELASVGASGVTVTPLSAGGESILGRLFEIHNHVHLDGREITRSVTNHTLDILAAR
jgi:hypothetical protein